MISVDHWEAVAHDAVTLHHAVQKETELAVLLTLLDRQVKPRSVLEIGSDLGGSLYAWSQLPSVQRVYAVTLPAPMNYRLEPHGATVIYGDSQDMDTIKRLEAAWSGYPDVVFIDGDHSRIGVSRDYLHYGWMARQLTVFHDVCHHPPERACHVDQFWASVQHYSGFALMRFSEIVHEPHDWGGYGLIWWSS